MKVSLASLSVGKYAVSFLRRKSGRLFMMILISWQNVTWAVQLQLLYCYLYHIFSLISWATKIFQLRSYLLLQFCAMHCVTSSVCIGEKIFLFRKLYLQFLKGSVILWKSTGNHMKIIAWKLQIWTLIDSKITAWILECFSLMEKSKHIVTQHKKNILTAELILNS